MSLRNPVRYPVKYYSWQDAQAPQLSNADGIIKTILKACLVTGYGTKQGAGWTSLFEDGYRIVLRRPLRTGNPPDIKIENGTITGTTVRHRIVAQDNPTGLDDAVELSAVNLLAKDYNGKPGAEWHCVVSDFGFLLCYQMGENGGSKKSALYVGGMKNTSDVAGESYYIWGSTQVNANGTNNNMAVALFDNEAFFKNARTGINVTAKNMLTITGTEKSINNDYFAQKILLGAESEMPFFTSIFNDMNNDFNTYQISINSRNMLRYPNQPFSNGYQSKRPLYIPLDYWEL